MSDEDVGCVMCCYRSMKQLESYFGMMVIEYFCPHVSKEYKTSGFRWKRPMTIAHLLISLGMLIYLTFDLMYFYQNLFYFGSSAGSAGQYLFRDLMSTYLFCGSFVYHSLRFILQKQHAVYLDALVNAAFRNGYTVFTKEGERKITSTFMKRNTNFFIFTGSLLVANTLIHQFQLTSNEVIFLFLKTSIGVVWVRFSYYEFQLFIAIHLEIMNTMQNLLKECLQVQNQFDFVRDVKESFREMRLKYMAMYVGWYDMHQFNDIMFVTSGLITFFWMVNVGMAVVNIVEGSMGVIDCIDLLLFMAVLITLESDVLADYDKMSAFVSKKFLKSVTSL